MINLNLVSEEHRRATGRYDDVTGCLNRAYFNDSESCLGSIVVGSWGKGTQITPLLDVDLYYIVPIDEFRRFEAYQDNGQSALLADVREKLLVTYPQTKISGDGQVVVVAFNNPAQIEVAPAVKRQDGKFVLPDSNDGGSWIIADPEAEYGALNVADDRCNNNARPLVRMMKCWQRHCNVPLKSFHIECLVCEFLPFCSWKDQGYYYYDWIVRDFLRYLIQRANYSVVAPGTGELMNIGDKWLSRAQSALVRAEKACEFERSDWVISAGQQWQKLFGDFIPETIYG